MGERGGQCRVVEALRGDPRFVLEGPVGPAAPHPPVAEQELAQAMPGPGLVDHHVRPRPTQVPDGLFGHARHPHRGQLAGTEQQRHASSVPAIGLDPVTGAGGDQRRGDHLAAHPRTAQRARQLVAGRAGLVARPYPPRGLEAADEAADRLVVGRDLVDHRPDRVRLEQRSRDGVLVHVHCQDVDIRGNMDQHGRLLPYVARSASSWWTTHADAERADRSILTDAIRRCAGMRTVRIRSEERRWHGRRAVEGRAPRTRCGGVISTAFEKGGGAG